MSIVREGRFYGRLFLSRVSKIAFKKLVWSSFKWLLCIDSAWMWNLSIIFRRSPFLWQCSTCRRNALHHWGVLQSCMLGYCYRRQFYALCTSWKIVYQSARRTPYCNQHQSLYAPDSEYMSVCLSSEFLCVSSFPIVFFVRKAILRSVCLKTFVMYEVSLPTYVKLAHFWGFFRSISWAGLGVLLGLWGLMGREFFCTMLCMMFSSCWYSSYCRLEESSLLNRNRTAAYLWCGGGLRSMVWWFLWKWASCIWPFWRL